LLQQISHKLSATVEAESTADVAKDATLLVSVALCLILSFQL